MKNLASLLIMTVCAATIVGNATATPITPAVTYTSDNPDSDSRPFTLGFSFSLSDSITVNALGVWNEANSAFGQQVGLWDSTGTLLVSSTIPNGATVQDNFAWNPIPEMVLGAGTYTIAATYTGGAFASYATG